jgi:hypothetical protein
VNKHQNENNRKETDKRNRNQERKKESGGNIENVKTK